MDSLTLYLKSNGNWELQFWDSTNGKTSGDTSLASGSVDDPEGLATLALTFDPVRNVVNATINGQQVVSDFDLGTHVSLDYINGSQGRVNHGMVHFAGATAEQGLVDNYVITVVPEPGMIGMTGLGALALLRRRRKPSN